MAYRTQTEVYGWPTYYEDGDFLRSDSYDDTFYARLETWAAYYYWGTPESWINPGRIYYLGVYNPNSPPMHSVRRAFDLTRIHLMVNGLSTAVLDARTVPTSTIGRKRYWAAAASLHRHFTYVITYPYNSAHHNHIHIDNQVSGSGNSVFNTSYKHRSSSSRRPLYTSGAIRTWP